MRTFPRRARRRAWISVAVFLVARAASAQDVATVRPLSYTRVVLANGLVALFNEDHSSPIVGIGVWYHVGAKDEQAGHTGLAHLCEHMMFEGSPNVAPGQFMAMIHAGGGNSTRWAETSEDRTFYYETVPSTMLEQTLWLEADRMARPFQASDSARLDAVRTVIRNERQANVENRPFGSANALTLGILYGGDHPYRGGLGPMDDLNGATFSGMRQFCAPYYVPNNAVIAMSGDFNAGQARAMVERYFGSIPRGAAVTHPRMQPTIQGERRVVLEDPRGRGRALRIAWAGVGFAEPDKFALNALAAELQGNAASGLEKALVYDRQLATAVFVGHFDNENGGVFQIEAYPRGATPLGAIEDVVDSVVRATRDARPTDAQLRRFKNANAVAATVSLQGRVFRADTLAQGQGWANDPVAYAKQVSAAARVTPADVQQVAAKYLTANRLVLSMVPAGKLNLASKPEKPYENAVSIMPAEVKR